MRVSVVIPSYNHARYIEEAIDSVAQQGDTDLEIVVVDDGSSDDSVQRIKARLEVADVASVVLHEQSNAGAHAAIGKGLDLASGECLAILNSDDFYLPGRLARVRECIATRDHYLIFSALNFVDESSSALDSDQDHVHWYARMIEERRNSPTLGFALMRSNLSVTSGNLIFSRSLYEEVGGFSDMRFCHDWDFVIRATRWVEPDFINEVLMSYRVHNENASHGLRGLQEREASAALNHYLDLCRKHPPINSQAPCPETWPSYFDFFVAKHSFHFDTHPIEYYIRDRR